MTEKRLRALAYSIAQFGLDKKTADFVMQKLNKKQLKSFVMYYKKALAKQTIAVTSAGELSGAHMDELKQRYKNMKLHIEIDPSLGAGIKIRHDDTIIDFTFKKYINDTIAKLNA